MLYAAHQTCHCLASSGIYPPCHAKIVIWTPYYTLLHPTPKLILRPTVGLTGNKTLQSFGSATY
eukprot:scaffold5314_cov167-Amphora_coffeaeformis.AAC.9